jgi:hypothetical protein
MDILKVIQEYMKCYKENCKDEYDNIGKDKKIQIFKNKNWKEIYKIIVDIYSNKNQKDFELCVYKKCSIIKDFQEYKINSLNKKIEIFEIKFSNDIKIKYNNLIKLFSKSSLTDEEYIDFIILFYYFDKIIEIKVMEKLFNILKHWENYSKCSKKKCNDLYNEVNNDEELKKKKILIFQYYNNEDERNKVIRDIYSNQKQVNLDKCMIKNCNKILLNLLQYTLKHFTNIIKAYDIKIPKEIKLPKIIKITEKDIPEIMIKYYQIFNYSNKYE